MQDIHKQYIAPTLHIEGVLSGRCVLVSDTNACGYIQSICLLINIGVNRE